MKSWAISSFEPLSTLSTDEGFGGLHERLEALKESNHANLHDWRDK